MTHPNEEAGQTYIQADDPPPHQETSIVRRETQDLAVNASANGAAVAAARAQIEARFELAYKRPRNWDDVRIKLLEDCRRPGFAKSARYRKPVGKKKNEETNQWEEAFIEGPSARFAEAAFRSMGNAEIQAPIIYDDSQQRTVRVIATDLETNATSSVDITVEKTVERRSLKQGQAALSSRMNSYGDRIFILPATDDEVHNKVNSLVSKSRRNLILQLLPADITEESMELCVKTLRAEDAKDPDAARREILDAFAALGIMPSELELFLEHDPGHMLPVERETLRAIYMAIKDGEATWKAVMESKSPPPEKADPKVVERKATVTNIIERNREKNRKKAEAARAAQTGQPPSDPQNTAPTDGAQPVDTAKDSKEEPTK